MATEADSGRKHDGALLICSWAQVDWVWFTGIWPEKCASSTHSGHVKVLRRFVGKPLALVLLLLLLLTAIELSLGGSSPYTSTDKTKKN